MSDQALPLDRHEQFEQAIGAARRLELLADVLERTEEAAKVVKRLARDSAVAKSAYAATERHRLEGKAEGLRLAVSYIREAIRNG